MGLEKSLGWDGIMVNFFKDFWLELSELITMTANKAFTKGRIEEAVTRGLIKSIPKKVSSSLLKHSCPISMMIVI